MESLVLPERIQAMSIVGNYKTLRLYQAGLELADLTVEDTKTFQDNERFDLRVRQNYLFS